MNSIGQAYPILISILIFITSACQSEQKTNHPVYLNTQTVSLNGDRANMKLPDFYVEANARTAKSILETIEQDSLLLDEEYDKLQVMQEVEADFQLFIDSTNCLNKLYVMKEKPIPLDKKGGTFLAALLDEQMKRTTLFADDLMITRSEGVLKRTKRAGYFKIKYQYDRTDGSAYYVTFYVVTTIHSSYTMIANSVYENEDFEKYLWTLKPV